MRSWVRQFSIYILSLSSSLVSLACPHCQAAQQQNWSKVKVNCDSWPHFTGSKHNQHEGVLLKYVQGDNFALILSDLLMWPSYPFFYLPVTIIFCFSGWLWLEYDQKAFFVSAETEIRHSRSAEFSSEAEYSVFGWNWPFFGWILIFGQIPNIDSNRIFCFYCLIFLPENVPNHSFRSYSSCD